MTIIQQFNKTAQVTVNYSWFIWMLPGTHLKDHYSISLHLMIAMDDIESTIISRYCIGNCHGILKLIIFVRPPRIIK